MNTEQSKFKAFPKSLLPLVPSSYRTVNSFEDQNCSNEIFKGSVRSIKKTKKQIIDWSILQVYSSADEAVDKVYEMVNNILDKNLPLYKYKNHTHQYPQWYTSEIIRLIKLKANRMKFRKD